MTQDPEPSYTLALEEARRGFDQLAGEVSDVRNRSVALLGMGGLAASFLGGLTLRNGAPVTAWTWVAVAAFVVLAARVGPPAQRRQYRVPGRDCRPHHRPGEEVNRMADEDNAPPPPPPPEPRLPDPGRGRETRNDPRQPSTPRPPRPGPPERKG